MNITIYTDGGSSGNPGPSASAYRIFSDGHLLEEKGFAIGVSTNNIAEYTALIRAFEALQKHQINKKVPQTFSLMVYADSQLMVRQLQGVYKVKDKNLKKLFDEVKTLELLLGLVPQYIHVMREKNAQADALVKKALRI